MSQQPPHLNRKSSAPWNRLRPVKQDPLESEGFVSKGDHGLLNVKTQESYYHKITARYMQFCTQHSKNLDEAFLSLSPGEDAKTPTAASRESGAVVAQLSEVRPMTSDIRAGDGKTVNRSAEELSTILTALRKLREGILATSSTAASPLFSQRVHVFNIRLAILARHSESYQASLRYLLSRLHSRDHPLPRSELGEMTSYLILDTALRLGDLNEAYRIRIRARTIFNFVNRDVDQILRTVVSNNWPAFWRMRSRVDGYMRAMLQSHIETIRLSVLKAIGKSYLKCNITWIVQNATGNEMDWDELVVQENVGWLKDGNVAIIRKPKAK